MMDSQSVGMVLGLVAQGIGVVEELAALARRAEAGERITDEDIMQARGRMQAAVDQWNARAEDDHR